MFHLGPPEHLFLEGNTRSLTLLGEVVCRAVCRSNSSHSLPVKVLVRTAES